MAVDGMVPEARTCSPFARFIEKRLRVDALALVAEGALWNAGMFVFAAETMLAALKIHAPDVLAAAGPGACGRHP